MNIKFRALWTAPVIALILFIGRCAYLGLRAHVLGQGLDFPSLRLWWIALACFYLLIAMACSATIVAIFRRYLDTRSMIASTSNIFMTCLLFALSAIGADPLVRPLLSTVGLSTLHYWLFGIAGFWVLLSIYVLFGDIDRHVGLSK
jgi:hypothetical protein